MLSASNLLHKNIEFLNKEILENNIFIKLSNLSNKDIRHYLSAFYPEQILQSKYEDLCLKIEKASYDKEYFVNYQLANIRNQRAHDNDYKIDNKLIILRPFLKLSLFNLKNQKVISPINTDHEIVLYFTLAYMLSVDEVFTLVNAKISTLNIIDSQLSTVNQIQPNTDDDEKDMFDTSYYDQEHKLLPLPVTNLNIIFDKKHLENVFKQLANKTLIKSTISENILDTIKSYYNFNSLFSVSEDL